MLLKACFVYGKRLSISFFSSRILEASIPRLLTLWTPMAITDMFIYGESSNLRTIFPGHSYDKARSISNLPTLFERRTKLCKSYFRKMHNADHKLHKLLPNQRNISYDPRTYNTLPVPLARTDRFRRSLIPWGLANWQHNVL